MYVLTHFINSVTNESRVGPFYSKTFFVSFYFSFLNLDLFLLEVYEFVVVTWFPKSLLFETYRRLRVNPLPTQLSPHTVVFVIGSTCYRLPFLPFLSCDNLKIYVFFVRQKKSNLVSNRLRKTFFGLYFIKVENPVKDIVVELRR